MKMIIKLIHNLIKKIMKDYNFCKLANRLFRKVYLKTTKEKKLILPQTVLEI